MHPSLASLIAVVPGLLSSNQVRLDSFGIPILVVIIKKVDGQLTITTEPKLVTTGMVKKLDQKLFTEGDVYEIEFGLRYHCICRRNGEQINDSDHHGISNFLKVFSKVSFGLSEELNRIIKSLPSADKISEALRKIIDSGLINAFKKKDSGFLITGPTVIQVISVIDSENIQRTAKMLNMLFATEAIEIRKDDLLMTDSDHEKIILITEIDKQDPFYDLVVKLMTEVIKTLLSDIFKKQRCHFECLVDAAHKTLHPEMYKEGYKEV